MNYGNHALRGGVEGWFHHMFDTAMAVEPAANQPANISLGEEAAITAFEFFYALDDMPTQEETPANIAPRKEAAIDTTGCDGSVPERMRIRKVPVLLKPYFIGYQPDEWDCETA